MAEVAIDEGFLDKFHLSLVAAGECLEWRGANELHVKLSDGTYRTMRPARFAYEAAFGSADGPHSKIGEQFGMSQTMISRIVRGAAWRQQ